MTAAWVKYTGEDCQYKEMSKARNGILARFLNGVEEKLLWLSPTTLDRMTHYLICDPHPLADMYWQWLQTRQPVWYKHKYMDYTGECSSRSHQPFQFPDDYDYYFTPTKMPFVL
jgi:hypothetical protein